VPELITNLRCLSISYIADIRSPIRSRPGFAGNLQF
jgi:hypothetical protein